MRRFDRLPLSEATDWRGILIDQGGSPGNLLHKPTKLTNILDEVYIWVENQHTSQVLFTVEFGGTSGRDDMQVWVPSSSGIQIVKGRPMADNLEIRIFASVISVSNAWGYINRILK